MWQSSSEYRFMTALYQVLCDISEEFVSSIFDRLIILCAFWATNYECELHSMGELWPQWEEHILRVVTSTDNWKLQPTERRLVIECLLKTSENITMKTHAYLFAWRLNLWFLIVISLKHNDWRMMVKYTSFLKCMEVKSWCCMHLWPLEVHKT